MISLEKPTLDTPRLILRPWRESDLAPCAAMNADPAVMRHFPKTLSRQESDALVERIESHFAQHGFGNFVVELRAAGEFLGFVGLLIPSFQARFTPCVEIGWRIRRDFQCRGYATEAARAVLRFAFETLKLQEVVSFTVPANQSSWALMERLGMTHNAAEDFDHPKLPTDHHLCRHILYRLSKSQWNATEARVFASEPRASYGRRIYGRNYIVRPGSYAVIQNQAGHVAITQTSDGIGLPGGGADGRESPDQTLHRELLEETGRKIVIHRRLGHCIEYVHSTHEGDFEKHCTFFQATFDSHDTATAPEPGTQILWLTPHEAIQVLNHESHRWAVAQTIDRSERPTQQ